MLWLIFPVALGFVPLSKGPILYLVHIRINTNSERNKVVQHGVNAFVRQFLLDRMSVDVCGRYGTD